MKEYKAKYESDCPDCQENNNPCKKHRKERDAEEICVNCKSHKNHPSRCCRVYHIALESLPAVSGDVAVFVHYVGRKHTCEFFEKRRA